MNKTDLHRDAMELIARAEGGVLAGQELVDWAVQALVAGYDPAAVVRLAGLDLDSAPLLNDAMHAFRAALLELDIIVPESREGILRAHGVELARQISVGEITPSEGVARMEREVVSPLNHPRDLMAWCYLSSDLNPDTLEELQGHEWEEYVLGLATRTHQEKRGE
jgi:hypothetical protein